MLRVISPSLTIRLGRQRDASDQASEYPGLPIHTSMQCLFPGNFRLESSGDFSLDGVSLFNCVTSSAYCPPLFSHPLYAIFHLLTFLNMDCSNHFFSRPDVERTILLSLNSTRFSPPIFPLEWCLCIHWYSALISYFGSEAYAIAASLLLSRSLQRWPQPVTGFTDSSRS